MRRAIIRLDFAALALTALAACTEAQQSSTGWIACKSYANDHASLQRRVAACSGLIKDGLKRDDLELALRRRAAGERQLEQYDPAVADDDKAIALDASDSEAVSDRGLARYGQGRYDLAVADFTLALRLDPDNAAALNGRAYVERRDGDASGAIRDESRAIELKPGWAEPWANRGLAYLDQHWFDMALADFADAVRRNRTLIYAYDGAGDAQKGKGDAAAASRAYLDASDVYFNRGDYDSAITESDKALDLTPNDPDALNSRCWSRAIAGEDLGLAEADCRRSLAARPGNSEVLDSLAFVHFRQGRLNEALQGFNEALAKNPKQVESLYMRGIVRLKLSDPGGQADLDASQSQDRSIAARYEGWGVQPATDPTAGSQ
jgi:tetratricopeptide (TPR) repeat protein